MLDVVIIGAGVSGSAIARELSRYNGNFLVLENNEDVCTGTSKANSGIVHGGYDAEEDSLMAKFNVLGNRMMTELSSELSIPLKRIGSLVLCFNEDDIYKLEKLKKRGEYNGATGLRIIYRDELRNLEPNVSDDACAALLCESAGIVDPFILNIAMAENAYDNGVEFKFNEEVINIEKKDDYFEVLTKYNKYTTKCVVNAAGVYADKFHNMLCEDKIEIVPRRGDYILLDKSEEGFVNHVLFQLPSKKGKGVLLAPTIDGNILIGPTATDILDKDDTQTTVEELNSLIEKANFSIKNIPFSKVITSFSGLRAHELNHEFIIRESIEGFFDCAGIESPGLTASPAIGVYLACEIAKKYNFKKNEKFNGKRKKPIVIKELDEVSLNELIKKDNSYGRIVCRCEKITEGEIIDAINRSLGAKTIDGVKRRIRATAGRCQGGFCTPMIMKILSRELNININDVVKNSKESKIILGEEV